MHSHSVLKETLKLVLKPRMHMVLHLSNISTSCFRFFKNVSKAVYFSYTLAPSLDILITKNWLF